MMHDMAMSWIRSIFLTFRKPTTFNHSNPTTRELKPFRYSLGLFAFQVKATIVRKIVKISSKVHMLHKNLRKMEGEMVNNAMASQPFRIM